MTELLNYKIRLDETRDSLIRIKSIINVTYNKIEDKKNFIDKHKYQIYLLDLCFTMCFRAMEKLNKNEKDCLKDLVNRLENIYMRELINKTKDFISKVSKI